MGAIAAVAATGHLDVRKLAIGQLMVTTIQLMTHYINEYYDLDGDRLNTSRTWFSGGSGALASGTLSHKTAFYAGVICGLIGSAALIVSSLWVPRVFLPGLIGLITAWSYSGPPLALERTGWGEIAASILVALIVPMVGYTMQSGGSVETALLVACIPLILVHLAMLIAFEIPDRFADVGSGKRTLVVRLGLVRGIWLHHISLTLAVCVILWLSAVHWPGSQYSWFGVPFAGWQIFQIGRLAKPDRSQLKYIWLTTGAVALFIVCVGLTAAGFIMRLQ